VHWKASSGERVVLNTDGARESYLRCGCGGLIRGDSGEWIGGFAHGIGECSVLVAELWGV
ncbi:ribonuclease H, partial [Trifolium medium]|nr:ribonuclease H [Trifolium medium]